MHLQKQFEAILKHLGVICNLFCVHPWKASNWLFYLNYLIIYLGLNKMCEVTRHNFEDEFPLIIERIRNAAFIAVDTEFTALTIDEQIEKSR